MTDHIELSELERSVLRQLVFSRIHSLERYNNSDTLRTKYKDRLPQVQAANAEKLRTLEGIHSKLAP